MATGILVKVRDTANLKVLFLPHALNQMNRPDRLISTNEVIGVVQAGEIAEDYPEDPRGHSCLMVGRGYGGRPIHVVCSPKDGYLAIITTYLPDPSRWSGDFSMRR